MSDPSVLIVGGGLAAVRSAQELRRWGHAGRIQMLSAEPEPPYDRPPLSKSYLRGELPEHRLPLWTRERYLDERVELQLDHAAVGLDATSREVTLDDGRVVAYERLVIATGAEARPPMPALAGHPAVSTLRTAEDARKLGSVLRAGKSLVVIGGGFIGLEVAATARQLGCEVTVIEAQQTPLLGVIGREAGEWLRSRHEALGIGFRCETTVESVSTPDDGSALLHLADGSEIGAAAVLVSVGVVRDCGWLAEAGLEVDGGLVCDAYGRSSLPDVFGAGDIVRVRGRDAIGHWTRAGDSARRAAHALMGLDKPSVADDGYFWSDQFEMRIQFAGRITERSRLEIVAGSLESGSFLAQVKSDDQLTGLFAVNKPRDFMVSQHKFTDQLTAALAVGASR